MTVLVLVAHIDDESFGCGGTIAKYSGCNTGVVVAALNPGGEFLRRNKMRISTIRSRIEDRIAATKKVQEELRIKEYIVGPWDQGELSKCDVSQAEVNHYVEGLIEKFDPVRVITHSPLDLHPDHRRVYEAALASVRPWVTKRKIDLISFEDLGANHYVEGLIEKFDPVRVITHSPSDLHPDHRRVYEAALTSVRPWVPKRKIDLISFEDLGSTGILPGWSPNMYVRLTAGHLASKLSAIELYDSIDSPPFPHPRSSYHVTSLARLRGGDSGSEFAEAFQIIRSYGVCRNV